MEEYVFDGRDKVRDQRSISYQIALLIQIQIQITSARFWTLKDDLPRCHTCCKGHRVHHKRNYHI